MELCAAITAFLADRSRRCNPRTVEWYGTFLRLFGSWCTEHSVHRVCDITPPVLSEYVEHLKRRPLQNRRTGGLSPVSVHKLSKSLRTFLLWLERERIAVDPLAAALPVPSAGRRIPKALPVAQARRLLSAPMSQRDRAMIALMIDAGPRAAEVAGLDLSDVDLIERTALIRRGKGDKSRMIVFGSEAATELRAWLAERPMALSPALFKVNDGAALVANRLFPE